MNGAQDSGASPFHDGENAVQDHCGVRDRVEKIGRAIIRAEMPPQHREFFAGLAMLFVGSVDAGGRPWASVLSGSPGFVRADGGRRLLVGARPPSADPLAASLRPGMPVGILGIDLGTRRRNRVNGTVAEAGGGGFAVDVKQSFGNCPQYIQARRAEAPPGPVAGSDVETGWNRDVEDLVRRSDTFFIASASAHPGGPGPGDGVDVSHRGGRPGFVAVTEGAAGAPRLLFPDFTGNFLFNTLGNLVANPRAGLLFPDFETGDVVQLSGAAEIVWDGEQLRAFAGAERLVAVTVAETRRRRGALAPSWSPPQFARQLEGTGVWPRAGAAVSVAPGVSAKGGE